jgi:hypothetical protein
MSKNDELLNKLDKLGFPLLKPENEDTNAVLADVVKSRDARLWEGFPAVLAHAAEKGQFDFRAVDKALEKPFDRTHFWLLVALALAVYKFFQLEFSWAEKLREHLSPEARKQSHDYLEALKNDSDFHVWRTLFSPRRVKATFQNYYQVGGGGMADLFQAKDEMGLEYSLSQVFSPKQKELFFKKLRNEKLTKTEKEYYSRTVRKKVFALANDELHQLARRLRR